MRAMRRGLLLGVLGLVLLSLGACAALQRAPSQTSSAVAPAASPEVAAKGIPSRGAAAAPAQAPAPPMGAMDAAGGVAATEKNAAQAGDDRRILRTADMAVAVTSVEDAARDVQSLADRLGGYVANANLFREADTLRGTISLRVPSDRLGEAMTAVEGLGRVENRRLSSNDVTEEYTDLNARLRNLEATERELLALLTTVREKSGRAEDVLAVHRELSTIRAQIEQLKGRINYLDKSSALATLNVTLLPLPAGKPLVDNGWSPLDTVREASRALVRLLQGVGAAAIWAIIVGLPLALAVAIPLWLVYRGVRRRPGRLSPGA